MKKITAIFACSALVLVGAISVAYYNTKSFGFDSQAQIFSADEKKLSFLDTQLYYDDVEEFFEQAGEYLPSRQQVIRCMPDSDSLL